MKISLQQQFLEAFFLIPKEFSTTIFRSFFKNPKRVFNNISTFGELYIK